MARRALRRESVAAAVLWAIWSLVPILVALRSWPSITALLITNALLIWAIVRLGLVAGVTASFVDGAIQLSPVTSDAAAPYAASSWFVLGGIALLVFYAARSAQRGQRLEV